MKPKNNQENQENQETQVRLYYFSGSGNTHKVGLKVKNAFENHQFTCTLESMEKVDQVNLEYTKYLGLLFPVAIQSTFPIVWDFVQRLPLVSHQKVFMLDTMEDFSGGVVGPMKKILESKGYNCIGAIELKMTSSIEVKETLKSKVEKTKNEAQKLKDEFFKKHQKKNAQAFKQAEQFIDDLLQGKTTWKRVPVLSDMMRHISKKRKIWTNTSKQLTLIQEACVLCKRCIKNCPVKAIEIKNQKLHINHEVCNTCMRCAHHCPKNAFRWKGKQLVLSDNASFTMR